MKRPLEHDEHDDPWWTTAVQWMETSGGMVHPDVTIESSSQREPVVTQDISKDVAVMQIPTSSVVSRETVEETSLGKRLASLIRTVASERALYHAEQDLLVALYLAFLKEQADQESDSSFSFRAYLDTLPSSHEYDKLPRRWSDEELNDLLAGSCLLDRVRKSQQGLRDDHERLGSAWNSSSTTSSINGDDKGILVSSFPSLSTFDDMLAAVTSRAFAGMASAECLEGDIAMVPLLDLCNHHRGTQVEKNITYQLNGNMIEARAHTDLKPQDTLKITYGAQGNSQLLFNYGFCVPDNVEPDGSSNDVFEFVLHPDQPPVELRIGPKSYTYGAFVKALELFHEQQAADSALHNDCEIHNVEDDMEAFLNECEEEEDEGDIWEENNENDGEEEEEDEEKNGEKDAVEAEVKALNRLDIALGEVLSRYSLPKREAQGNSDVERFAKILINSECRTVAFYQCAAKRILTKLTKSHGITRHELFSDGDDERLDKFVDDLVDAFLRIRYPMLE